jgi:hypothetical protein
LMSLVKSPIAAILHSGNMQAQAVSRPDIRFMFDADWELTGLRKGCS